MEGRKCAFPDANTLSLLSTQFIKGGISRDSQQTLKRNGLVKLNLVNELNPPKEWKVSKLVGESQALVLTLQV